MGIHRIDPNNINLNQIPLTAPREAPVFNYKEKHIASAWDRNATGFTGNVVSLARAVFSGIKLPVVIVGATFLEKWSFSDVTKTFSDFFRGLVGTIPFIGQLTIFGLNHFENKRYTQEHLKNTSLRTLSEELHHLLNQPKGNFESEDIDYMNAIAKVKHERLATRINLLKALSKEVSTSGLEKLINDAPNTTAAEQDALDAYIHIYKTKNNFTPDTWIALVNTWTHKADPLSRLERVQAEMGPYELMDVGQLGAFTLTTSPLFQNKNDTNDAIAQKILYGACRELKLRKCGPEVVQELSTADLAKLYERVGPQAQEKIIKNLNDLSIKQNDVGSPKLIAFFKLLSQEDRLKVFPFIYPLERINVYRSLPNQANAPLLNALTKQDAQGLFQAIEPLEQLRILKDATLDSAILYVYSQNPLSEQNLAMLQMKLDTEYSLTTSENLNKELDAINQAEDLTPLHMMKKPILEKWLRIRSNQNDYVNIVVQQLKDDPKSLNNMTDLVFLDIVSFKTTDPSSVLHQLKKDYEILKGIQEDLLPIQGKITLAVYNQLFQANIKEVVDRINTCNSGGTPCDILKSRLIEKVKEDPETARSLLDSIENEELTEIINHVLL